MARRAFALLAALACNIGFASAYAQPADLPIAPANSAKLPDGISVNRKIPTPVYTDSRGRTLYGLDMRTVLRWSPDPSKYCSDECLTLWEPIHAPKGSVANIGFPGAPSDSPAKADPSPDIPALVENRSAPDWTIIDGPTGPQWVYKGWHMVFTRRGDKKGSIAFDGADGMTWNTLKFVPAPPELVAPAGIAVVLFQGNYIFADKTGNLLFTGTCTDRCDGWSPLPAGLANQGIGKWQVLRNHDVATWSFGGAQVYRSDQTGAVPTGATLLRP
jgi:predicted lipoprotein with Yx(FWY)xxD motif